MDVRGDRAGRRGEGDSGESGKGSSGDLGKEVPRGGREGEGEEEFIYIVVFAGGVEELILCFEGV